MTLSETHLAGGMPANLRDAVEFHHHALLRLRRSPQTLRLYRIYQASFLAFLDEQGLEPTLDALTPQFVREWQSWLRSRSTGRRGGAVTEKQGVMTLKTWGRFLWENDVYAFDPLGRLKTPRVQKIHRKPFSEDETRRLVQAASAGSNPIRDRALLLLMFDTGCRVGELCAATLADLDVDQGTILFNKTKNGHPRLVRFRVPDRRDGGPALQALRQWLKVRDARTGIDNIFTTRERLPLSTRRVREIFETLGEAARVPQAGPHRARHTAASEFLAARPGAEIQLRSRLGHVGKDHLADYVSISDQTAVEAAGVASISSKWNLGSGAQSTRSNDQVKRPGQTNQGSEKIHYPDSQSGAVLDPKNPATRSKLTAATPPARFCPACGYQRADGHRFCAGCGRAIEGAA